MEALTQLYIHLNKKEDINWSNVNPKYAASELQFKIETPVQHCEF